MLDDTTQPSSNRLVKLLGQPQLEDYVDFVRDKVVGGGDVTARVIADEWRAANDYYGELERSEAGIAEEIERRPLDAASRRLAKALLGDEHFTRTFDALPTTIELVELDRMVVCQQSVVLDFTERLQESLGSKPSSEDVFRFCQAIDRPSAAVNSRRIGDNRFLFWSDSTDFRAHDPELLRPDQVTGLSSSDPVSAVIGLVVGYGSNFLQAVAVDDRVILHNGYHRAYALRAAGITHVPCVVQTVTRRDELNLVASEAVTEEPEFFCEAERPPLLKDFFDPRIRKELIVHRAKRMIEVAFDIREFQVVDR